MGGMRDGERELSGEKGNGGKGKVVEKEKKRGRERHEGERNNCGSQLGREGQGEH